MKNIVMLSVILAVVSVPRYLYADDLVFSRNDGCLVDSTLNYQRFYYCGWQSADCGSEKHNNGDYSVCNDGTELQREKDGLCYLTGDRQFTTRSGDTFYCCNGTDTSMGTIQRTACQSTGGLMPATGGGNGSGLDGFWSGSGSDNENRTGEPEGGGGSDQPEPPEGETPASGGGNGLEEEIIKKMIEQSARIKKIVSDIKKEPDEQYDPETCPDGIRYGNNPKTGACIECAIGKYYNSKDEKNGYCSYAIGLTKTDMMYGYGKTQNSNPRLRNQCWTIKDIVRYRACVLSGVQKPMTIKVPIQSAMDTAVVNTVSEK